MKTRKDRQRLSLRSLPSSKLRRKLRKRKKLVLKNSKSQVNPLRNNQIIRLKRPLLKTNNRQVRSKQLKINSPLVKSQKSKRLKNKNPSSSRNSNRSRNNLWRKKKNAKLLTLHRWTSVLVKSKKFGSIQAVRNFIVRKWTSVMVKSDRLRQVFRSLSL